MQINDSFKRCFMFLLEEKPSLKESLAATKDDQQTKLLSSWWLCKKRLKKNKTKHLLQCSDCKWVTLYNIQEGVLDRTGGDSLQWLQGARKESLVPDLHLPLSPSKRPWWRITAKVRKEERGHGEVHDRKEKRYCELPLGFLLCGPTELRQPGRTPNNVMCFPRSLQILCSKTTIYYFMKSFQ